MLLLVCATLSLGVTEAAWGQELPLPLPADTVELSTAVSAALEGVAHVEPPKIAVPVVPPPTEVVVPTLEPGAAAAAPAEAAPEAQYQQDEPQYQEPETVPVEPETLPQEPPAAADTTVSTQTAPLAGTSAPAATTETEEPAAATSLPETWTWNWDWNCEGEPVMPTPPASATDWQWNWRWQCDSAVVPQVDLDQYQAPITQYQAGNTNIGIRIASPGDNGPVTQTISTVTQVTTTIVNEVVQSVVQVVQAAAPLAAGQPQLPVLELVPQLPLGGLVPVSIVVPSIAAVTIPSVAPSVSFPPLNIAGPLVELASLTSPEAVAGRPPGQVRPRPRAADEQPQLGPSTWSSGAWTAAASEPSPPQRPASAPTPERPRHAPLPPVPGGGTGLGGGQSSSAPALVLAALAAALAAYLLVPPLGARRLRPARDRRRLGLLAAPLDRPG